MSIQSAIREGSINPSLAATDKSGAIRELLSGLVAAKAVDEQHEAELLTAIERREELGSTGIGCGVAIPHAKHPFISQTTVGIGINDSGIDFQSIDNEPTHLFFLVLSPHDQPAHHLQTLEFISRILSDDMLRRELRQARTSSDVLQTLERHAADALTAV